MTEDELAHLCGQYGSIVALKFLPEKKPQPGQPTPTTTYASVNYLTLFFLTWIYGWRA